MIALELFFLLSVTSLVSSAYTPFVPNPRIIGGVDAPDGSAPYQVSLRDINLNHFCGGSILNKRWIVTAAHCLTPDVFIDSVYMGSNLLDSKGRYYDVEKFVVHANYTGKVVANYADIGLVKLSEDIKFTDKVQAIKIHENYIRGGEVLKATGWGRLGATDPIPNALQELETIALSDESCQEKATFLDPTSQICTFSDVGKGICFGDSGGPLVYQGEQVGVASFIMMTCGGGLPDVFVRILDFRDWIDSHIAADN